MNDLQNPQEITAFFYRAGSWPRISGLLVNAFFAVFCFALMLENLVRILALRITIGNAFSVVFLAAGTVAFCKIIGSYTVKRIAVHPDRLIVHGLFGQTAVSFDKAVFHHISPSPAATGAAAKPGTLTVIEGTPWTKRSRLFLRSVFGRNITIQMRLLADDERARFFAVLADLSKRPTEELITARQWTAFYAEKSGKKK